MKKIRPAIFAMLLLIMVMSVTACGSNNSNTQSSTGASQNSSSAATSTSTSSQETTGMETSSTHLDEVGILSKAGGVEKYRFVVFIGDCTYFTQVLHGYRLTSCGIVGNGARQCTEQSAL